MTTILAVAAGGALVTLGRYLVVSWIGHRPAAVAIYVLASVTLSLAGAFAGYHLTYATLA